MDSATLGLLSLLGNAICGVVIPWLGRKLKARSAAVEQAKAVADALGEGLRVIDRAVEANKESPLARTTAGKAITGTIRDYGDAAIAAVDTARRLASDLSQSAIEAREAAVLAREREERAREIAAREGDSLIMQ